MIHQAEVAGEVNKILRNEIKELKGKLDDYEKLCKRYEKMCKSHIEAREKVELIWSDVVKD